jgi:glycosyltransferase involved in cell wall biosynthesis
MNCRKEKEIYIIGTVGIPACYGGFESLVQNLVDYQSKGVKYNVFCSTASYAHKHKSYKDANLIYLPLKANGISSIAYDVLSLFVCLFKRPDVTLILGVSGCIFLPIYKFFSNSRIVVNIDGLEWKRDKWGGLAKAFLKLSEKIAVFFSDTVISDNQAIADYVKSEYGIGSEVIAYGGDHALLEDHRIPFTKGEFFLSICRIEPENNVVMVLEAFSKSSEKLRFVGNWNSSAYGRSLREAYSKCNHIEMIDPIYDIETLFELRAQCKGYIHGHSAGGTNPSLVEAMQFGMPIYAFDCTFNRYTTDNSALYFNNEAELRQNIKNYDERAVDSGLKMMRIAIDKYQWRGVVDKYETFFN